MPSPTRTGAPPARREARWRLLAAALAALALLVAGSFAADEELWALRRGGTTRPALASLTPGGSGPASGPGARARDGVGKVGDPPPPGDAAGGGPPAGGDGPAGDDPARTLARRRLARAEETLRRYLESTRYPPTSRPLYEHADQADLPEPERTLPLDPDDPEGTRVRARQSTVFVAGDESVAYVITCEKSGGEPVSCGVEAYTERAEHYGSGVRVATTFVGDGARFAAVLTPARDGFAGTEGTLRTWVRVRADGRERPLFFDVLFTPSPPAHLSGRVDEHLDQGSLVLALEVVVERPGRFVALGRVDDADREPLALVSFNEELGAGVQAIPLVVFGKLVRDLSPAFPLVLRDVQVFRLREEGDPDRELLPTAAGPVHVTRSYPLDVFSDDEWQSEERRRYVQELTADVERAGGGEKGPPAHP